MQYIAACLPTRVVGMYQQILTALRCGNICYTTLTFFNYVFTSVSGKELFNITLPGLDSEVIQ
jgi:hypothetical protein